MRLDIPIDIVMSPLKEATDALAAYEDTNDHPTGVWIKRKGKGGDLANPNNVT